MHRSSLLKVAAPLLVIGAMACGNTASPNSRPMSVSFSSQSPTTVGAALADVTVTAGTNTLVMTKAQVVVRRIKLEQGVTATCMDDDNKGDDDCAETSIGPVLVTLPLTANTVTSVDASIPPGTYRKIDFRIHKPSGDANDAAFVTANPTFANSSIRVEGTYNGTAFVFTSTVSEKEELEFNPPIVIDATNKNVTVQIDVSSWFKSGTTVIDPATANPGQPNENLVRNNIRASLRALEDDDKKGH
jgi:hypothetical protein